MHWRLFQKLWIPVLEVISPLLILRKIFKFAKIMKSIKNGLFLKVHVLICHVPEFLEGKSHGLGIYSEQMIESAHNVFEVDHWRRYKVNEKKIKYPKMLLKAVNLLEMLLTIFKKNHLKKFHTFLVKCKKMDDNFRPWQAWPKCSWRYWNGIPGMLT